MIELTTQQALTECLDNNSLVVVDFWAPWCAPCKTLTPIFEEVSQECTTATFAKVNVDESDIGISQGIRSIPTIKVFKGGVCVHTSTGAMSKTKLAELVTKFL